MSFYCSFDFWYLLSHSHISEFMVLTLYGFTQSVSPSFETLVARASDRFSIELLLKSMFCGSWMMMELFDVDDLACAVGSLISEQRPLYGLLPRSGKSERGLSPPLNRFRSAILGVMRSSLHKPMFLKWKEEHVDRSYVSVRNSFSSEILFPLLVS